MQARLQCVEGKRVADRNSEFAIQYESIRRKRPERSNHVREIPCERLAGLGPQFHLVAGAKGEASTAIPLRLELPSGFSRQFIHQPSLHRMRFEGHRSGPY